ncbi:MAG TPA: hypothetical protein VK797_06885 [Tepidisphaeraceae bacterium]|jgi:hypothetical protein|nr:hypothetical protein [Tepidisphaeraceae bacterium]
MTQVDVARRSQIASEVQAALDRHQPRKYQVKVDQDAILEEDGWYHVVVQSDNDQRDRDFYDALAEAEEELNDGTRQNQFLLVPAIGD